MARRVVNGSTHSENGWPLVDQAGCTWTNVPGVDVTLQIQSGPALALLRAWAADWNAYIEPLRDADSASWTPTNDVLGGYGKNNGSNHLGGTAIDLNWGSHPFRKRGSLNAAQMATMAEMEKFYEGNVFWAGRWDNPVDEMHSQCGYNTWDPSADRPRQSVIDFIARKIRADGFSTFRRGNNVELSKKDRYALAVINEGRRLGISDKGIKIALATTLVETNLTMYANRNVPDSLNYPHDAVGSDHDSTGLFQQRQAWGPLSSTMDPTKSAGLFYLGGNAGQRGLTDFDYNSDARTPGGWAQAVQVSAFPDRYDERFGEASDIFNRLSNLGDDDMANVPQDQWDWVYNELHKLFDDRSMYGPHNKDTFAGRAVSAAGMAWEYRVESSALRGEQWAIAEVAKAAQGTNDFLVNHAKAVLAEIEAKNPSALQAFLNGAE